LACHSGPYPATISSSSIGNASSNVNVIDSPTPPFARHQPYRSAATCPIARHAGCFGISAVAAAVTWIETVGLRSALATATSAHSARIVFIAGTPS
jgi:hypothetical protein